MLLAEECVVPFSLPCGMAIYLLATVIFFYSPRVVDERRDLMARQGQLLLLSQAFNRFHA